LNAIEAHKWKLIVTCVTPSYCRCNKLLIFYTWLPYHYTPHMQLEFNCRLLKSTVNNQQGENGHRDMLLQWSTSVSRKWDSQLL